MQDQAFRIRSYFDAAAEAYARQREREFSFAEQKRIALELLPARMERVLDAGCGPAVMAPDLLARADEYWGTDLSAQMIAYGRARMESHPRHSSCHLQVADAEALDYPTAFFDAIVSLGMLEYLVSHERVLAGMFHMLKPGGVAVLAVPNRASLFHRSQFATARMRSVAKGILGRPPRASERFVTNRSTPRRLDAALTVAGFTKLEERFCNFIFHPLHELHADLSLALNQRLTALGQPPLARWLGSQYIVKVLKPR